MLSHRGFTFVTLFSTCWKHLGRQGYSFVSGGGRGGRKPTFYSLSPSFLRETSSKLRWGIWVTCYEGAMVERIMVSKYLWFFNRTCLWIRVVYNCCEKQYRLNREIVKSDPELCSLVGTHVVKCQKFRNLMFLDVENEENVGFGGKGLRQKNSSRTEQLLLSSFIYILSRRAAGTTPHVSFSVSDYTYTLDVELTGSNSSFSMFPFLFPSSPSPSHFPNTTEGVHQKTESVP